MKNFFKSLANFVRQQRRSGTTELIKKIAEENDVWVLVPSMSDGLKFKKGSAISVHQITQDVDNTLEGKPILVDNQTLLKLMSMAEAQESKLKAIQDAVSKFKTSIDAIEKTNVFL